MKKKLIAKIYKNLPELVDENNLDSLIEDHIGPDRRLEDYLDDYSDRDIVRLFVQDIKELFDNKIRVMPKRRDGWINQKIEVS